MHEDNRIFVLFTPARGELLYVDLVRKDGALACIAVLILTAGVEDVPLGKGFRGTMLGCSSRPCRAYSEESSHERGESQHYWQEELVGLRRDSALIRWKGPAPL